MSSDDAYRESIHIAADPSIVYDYFTRPEALVRWMGDRAILDPRPGGRFTVFFGDRIVEGRYLDLDPPRRLVVSWGRVGSATFAPSSSTLEVSFTPEAGGTRVSIVHTGVPESERQRHALGWRHYLTRLAIVAAGGVAGVHVVPEALTEGVD
jgi:uncharacterized protein YndB with AHSA1/START domain